MADDAGGDDGGGFYDSRQTYLMFIQTFAEKPAVARRVVRELARIEPRPPALRLFDAGIGDGTVLLRVLRAMHARFPRVPFYVAGKEISLEDVRLTLERLPDRFVEHPETVIAISNLSYADAPWLGAADGPAPLWREVALAGDTSEGFDEQLQALEPFLAENWQTRTGKGGALVAETPAVLVIHRQDRRFVLDGVIPHQGQRAATFDLMLASQPFRSRARNSVKAERVLAPLARALGPGGRLLGIQAAGNDPGLELIHRIWPDERPFPASRHDLLDATRIALGAEARRFRFDPLPDDEAIFRYDMHALPGGDDEAAGGIGTSAILAAWNAAVYVAQMDPDRVAQATEGEAHLAATRAVIDAHGPLWFNDESYVIARID